MNIATKYAENEISIVSLMFDLTLFTGVVVPENAENNMLTTDTAGIDPLFKEASDSLFVDYHKSKLVFKATIKKIPMKLHSGKSFTARVKHRLKAKNTQLVEGKTPEPSVVEVSTVTGHVEQHGNYIMHTDLTEDMSMKDIVNLDRELLADQAADVENALIRDDILAADSIGLYYAEKVDENFKIVEGGKIDDKSQIDPSCKITYDLCRRVLNIMERNKIPFAKGKSYHWYLHPDQKYDLMSDPKWEAMKIHTDPSDMEDGEIGRVSGMIFLESDTVLVTKDGANLPVEEGAEAGSNGKYAVYHSLVMGGDSVGQLDLGGRGVQMIVKGLGSGGTADPLNQRATTAWKSNLGILVTDPLAIIEVMSGSYYSDEAEATEIVYEDPQT